MGALSEWMGAPAYYTRYGGTPRLPTREERRALRRALAQGLGWGGWLRALWALPPKAR